MTVMTKDGDIRDSYSFLGVKFYASPFVFSEFKPNINKECTESEEDLNFDLYRHVHDKMSHHCQH